MRQKLTDARTLQSDGQLATILRQLPVAVAVLDSKHRLVWGNDALDRFMTGGADVMMTQWRSLQADGSALPDDQYPDARALRGETTVPGLDIICRLDSGAEVWITICAAPLRDTGGKIQGVVTALKDLDPQRRTGPGEAVALFRQAADTSTDIFWIHNAVDRLEYLSPGFHQTWGIAPEAAMSDFQLWRDRVHPDDRMSAGLALEDVVSLGKTLVHEYRIVRPDGAVRRLQETAFPIRNAEGRVIQVGGIAHDITRQEGLSVYLINQQPQAQALLAGALRRAGHKVTSFASEQAFLDVVSALSHGCVLMRTRDTARDRFELARVLRARRIDLPVIFETDLAGDVSLAIAAMKAGAADVLQAPSDPNAQAAAVTASLASTRDRGLEADASAKARELIARMSRREHEVLQGLLAGGTNKTIARALNLSPRTVEIYRARVMERLGVRTLSEAIMIANAGGLKPSPPSPPFGGDG